ncbi:unnamed protein product [Urochloa humidicola]
MAAAYPRGSSLLLLLPLYAAYICSLLSPRANALSFSYNFSSPGDLNDADLKYINDSVRSSDRVDLTIRYKSNSTGRVFYTRPVRLWNGRTGERASFNTSFTFAMIGAPDRPSRGDGMAFFVGPFPVSLPPGSGGAFLGLFADPRSPSSGTSPRTVAPIRTVAVEFDTYRNTLWDPREVAGDHMGIDVNSIISSNYTTSLGNADLNGTMSATVVYNAGSKLMVATLQLANGSTHTVQASLDFRDVGLPEEAAVGFSAATGANVQTNQILSWSFSSTDLASSSKIQVWVIILLSAAACAVLAGSLSALRCLITRRQRPVPLEIALAEQVPRNFSYRELSTATKDFSENRKLGAGSFGTVYRGDLRDRRFDAPVAVKKLTLLLEQTRRDYVNEIMILGQLRHQNLVKLVGWCDGGGDDKLLLVYELVTNGSLDVHLHRSPERLLTWPERYRIAIGIGKAIEYLHTGNREAILHRDIKPSNVMLDDAFEAKARRLRAREAGKARAGLPRGHGHGREQRVHRPRMHQQQHCEHGV